MTERNKKILIIIGFIIIFLILAFLIYYLFFRQFFAPPAPPPLVPVNVPPEEVGLPAVPPAVNIPPAAVNLPAEIPAEVPSLAPAPAVPGPAISFEASGGLTSFSTLETNKSKNPTLANNGEDLIYYDEETSFFYTLTPEGEKKVFSDRPFKNVENVTWAPNNQKAVIEYPDGSNIVYDFRQKTSITLPKHWKDFTFSNDSKKIAFKSMKLDPENRSIAIVDSNGTGYQEIEKIGNKDEDVHITWAPNNKYVALYRESIDGDRAEVFPIGFHNENFRKFRVEGRDLKFKWSPSGNKLLYSVYNSRSNFNPSLWVVNTSPELLATGRNSLELQTWADKCVFASETTAYCAVPRSLETGTGFRPDLADQTPDNIYKIDIINGTKELAAEPLFPTTIDKLIISQDNQSLYWLEKNTGQIKKMNL